MSRVRGVGDEVADAMIMHAHVYSRHTRRSVGRHVAETCKEARENVCKAWCTKACAEACTEAWRPEP